MAKKKIKTLNKNDFLLDISKKANYLPLQTITDVYYAMIRTIVQELRTKGAVELPDLGVLVTHIHKARRALDVNTRNIVNLPEKTTIKFKTCEKLKKYFHLKG